MRLSTASLASGHQRAFTLVEVVVSLAVLSLVLLATITALRTFANTQQTLTSVISRVDEVRTVSSFLRDQLESSVLGAQSDGLTLGGGANEGAYFRGDAKAMEWKATVKFGESFGGKYLLRVLRQGDELMLQWQEVPITYYDISWEGAESRRLVDQVESFQLAYRLRFDEPWQEDLEDGITPDAVRIRLQTRRQSWPDLVMVVPR